MRVDEALNSLRASGESTKAAQMAAYHKVDRHYLGVSNPVIDSLVREWRSLLPLDGQVELAAGLWQSDIHEAMVAAAKLLTRRTIAPSDEAVWSLVSGWVEAFDAWAVADHATLAGQKRLMADTRRIAEIATWTRHPNVWTRRAALVITLPFAKLASPDVRQLEIRQRVLGWAAGYVSDREWFIQKAIAWWLRELSKVDPAVTAAFLEDHGADMKVFARREAAKYLPRTPEGPSVTTRS